MPRELTHGIDFLFLFLKRQLRELDFRIRGYLIIKRIALFPDMNDALVIEKFNDNYKNRDKEDTDNAEELRTDIHSHKCDERRQVNRSSDRKSVV